MTRRMLINATHLEETRVAIVQDNQLVELEIERADQIQLKGNVYKAKITRIEPSLQAAFLDIGANRNGFLQINDIHSAYFRNQFDDDHPAHFERPAVQEVLQAGQDLVVQVVKDERDAKGATLTTNLSIPGRYLVLMIGNQRGGVSRKINDESQRYRLKQAVQNLQVPAGMGVIVRTAGINKSSAELQRDLDGLLEFWYELVSKSFEAQTPRLLYEEPDLAIRMIRDYLTTDIEQIIIDEPRIYQRARSFIERVLPNFAPRLTFHEDPQPLFSCFHLDFQVETINQPEVTLPSGGSVIINITEAVVSIDVNSGRSTGQSDVEETAFATNKEAAGVIAKQLCLRDLGGLIVIDFIDMGDKRHKLVVENALKDALRNDKAKVEMGRISKFGLLEMSRQRLKPSLVSQSHVTCPHCTGRGHVKTPETAALEALRKIESAVFAGGVLSVRLRMAPAAALFLLNNKRKNLSALETKMGISILVYADGRMRPEEYELELDTGKREPTLGGNLRTSSNEYTRKDPPPRRDMRRDSAKNSPREDSRRRGGRRNQSEQGNQNRSRSTKNNGRAAPAHNRNRYPRKPPHQNRRPPERRTQGTSSIEPRNEPPPPVRPPEKEGGE